MAQRQNLQELLESFTENVYFQPPSNIQMQYPCIVYRRDTARVEFADNLPHLVGLRYEVTVIDRDPDSSTLELLSGMPMTVFNRHFVADNLNHDVFTMYWKGMTA